MKTYKPGSRYTSAQSRLSCCIYVIVLMLAASACASDSLVPTGGSGLTLDIGGQRSTYYRLREDSVLELQTSGPGTLNVIVRLAIPAGFRRDSAGFRIVVTVGADTARDVRATTAIDNGEWVGRSERPAVLQTLSLPVQEGRRTYRFHMPEADGPYAGLQFLLKRSTWRSPARSSPR